MNYFPTYLAQGDAFCNRKEELERMIYDLEGNAPVLLISPRRYGKTSLALKTFARLKWPYVHVDLYKALDIEDVEKYILNGIGKLLSQLENIPQKLLHLASDFFSNMHIKVVLEKAGIQLEFNPKKSATDTILKALEKLHDLAKKKKKRVILYLDEFQVMAEISSNSSIEAAIRECAQKATHVSYVFSGSNRHLMEKMFYDRNKPFYKLCDQIKLDRISEIAYEKHIQMAAKKTWKTTLSKSSLEAIFGLTERHSYYVNKLCSLLWQKSKVPTANDVQFTWHQFVLESKALIEKELSLLSVNQRKILIFLACSGPVNELFSKELTQEMKLSPSSTQRATASLIEKDYIYIDEKKLYRILDPLIKDVLDGTV